LEFAAARFQLPHDRPPDVVDRDLGQAARVLRAALDEVARALVLARDARGVDR
jgi:hypothetical protein